MLKKFPFYLQLDAKDCGAACLKMIAKYHGKNLSIEVLREKCHINREGTSLMGISDAAESLGLHTLASKISFKNLKEEAPMPCIVHWRERHYLIVHAIKKNKVYIADPAHGLTTLSVEEFKDGWISSQGKEEPEGFALFLEPTATFYEENEENTIEKRKRGIRHYLTYLRPYKKFYYNIILNLALATAISVILPFLTQAVVDVGVSNHDLNFVYIILVAQIFLFLSMKAGEIIRGWLLLHMTTRINISILSDFLIKLMKLPVSYFDQKTPGDVMQRMNDHEKIQTFFTASSLEFIFTISNIVVFGSILAFYNTVIFLIYAIGSILYFAWIFLFMKKRKELNYKYFDQAILNQNNSLQLVTGMQEIKLQNCERQKRWEWERIQIKNFKLGLMNIAVTQAELAGSNIINELKNILLTFYAATLVIQGEMTLGMMLAISFIVGQLNWITPNLINFMHAAQAAKLSIDRLSEIHNADNEERETDLIHSIDEPKDIVLKDISFQYGGERSPFVFTNLNLTIPKGKVTAIVGSSGSGKTTLLKLLLRSYNPTSGSIHWGVTDIKNISYKSWRNKFACVMQESFIFPDTIARNIAIGEEIINKERLKYATIGANIREFIESLPIEYNTRIGQDGIGLSQGQKQRLLLARAIYKDSDILLLDEATNALDANNEKLIISNLDEYVKGRTVVVVAHRLSTVRNADQIIVLEKGEIMEIGSHNELVGLKGSYYNLIKNQLELGA